MATQKHVKIKLREVNRHLVCRLCRGYYVDATTIAECLHSFCRSCIIKYLEKNSFCPICEVQIHKTKPYLNLRLDKALQDVVYKVVPGLYHDEMKRRRDFYAKRQEQIPFATPEQCGLEERIIFSPEDSISLSLEYLESDDYESETVSSQSSESGDNPEALSFPQQLGLIKLKNGEGKGSRKESQDLPDMSAYPKRYLQCPAVVNIGHLKKFIRMKHDVTDKMQVSIIHKRVPLPDHYTLMDVAYIYTWKRFAYSTNSWLKINLIRVSIDPSDSPGRPYKLRGSNSVVNGVTLCTATHWTEAVVPNPMPAVLSYALKKELEKSAPLRFFYQIYRTKKHSLGAPLPVQEAKGFKPQAVVEDQKSVKSVAYEKHGVACAVNSEEDDNQSAKSNADKSNASASEFNRTVFSDMVNHVDGNKPLLESGSDKFEMIIKSEPSDDSFKKETKDESVVGLNADKALPGGKNEKSKAPGVNDQENRSKEENEKSKSGKVESVTSVQEVKENKLSLERFLLNSTSGQTESVPSSVSVKSALNGGIFVEGSKESAEFFKREIGNKGQRKMESKNTKDSKKSNVNLLKSFRKEKFSVGKEGTGEVKKIKGYSLIITPVSKNDKPPEKEVANFSVEIKAESKESEYDFDGFSPPSKITPLQKFSKYSKYSKYMADHRGKWLPKESKNDWMPLEDFREKMLKENNSETDFLKKYKKKVVPSLHRINSEKNKTPIRKTPNEKLPGEKWKGNKIPRTIISTQAEAEEKKEELKLEVSRDKTECPQKPKKIENKDKPKFEIVALPEKAEGFQKSKIIENKDGEFNVMQGKDKSSIKQDNGETNSETKRQSDDGSRESRGSKESPKGGTREKAEGEDLNNKPPNSDARKNDQPGAMDLSKVETSPNSEGSHEGSADTAVKTPAPKIDDKTMEALVMATQKQNLEFMLKIPQYSQILKNSLAQCSRSPVKNISQNEISQALQFLEDLRSDIKVLEAKNQLNSNSALEQFAQKPGNFQPYQELYQQKIDLIRRLKRHNKIMPNDSESPQRKLLKLSPTSESKKKLSPTSESKKKLSPTSESKKKLSPTSEQKPKSSKSEEVTQYKTSIDKTLSQIQFLDYQTRMLAAQNYKNLPALLQYYNRAFCSMSPTKSSQQKAKPSSHSPNSSKSPQGLSSPPGNVPLLPANTDSFFNSQNYLINVGLNSEMTYHQMFQSYLNQQEQMNQVKLSQAPKKPVKFSEISAKSLQEKYYVPQTTAKKPEANDSVAPTQKT